MKPGDYIVGKLTAGETELDYDEVPTAFATEAEGVRAALALAQESYKAGKPFRVNVWRVDTVLEDGESDAATSDFEVGWRVGEIPGLDTR